MSTLADYGHPLNILYICALTLFDIHCILTGITDETYIPRTKAYFGKMFTAFGNFIGRPLSWMTGGVLGQPTSSANGGHDAGSADTNVEPHEPSILDVLVVKAMLSKAFALPTELLDAILDSAEYWPHSTTEWAGGPLSIYGGRPHREDVFLLRSIPLGFTSPPDEPDLPLDYETTPLDPRPLQRPHSLEAFQRVINSPNPLLEHPCRKIVFTFRSHDQGWGGDPNLHGTYETSWTWFDAGLEKFDVGEETQQGKDDAPPELSLTKLRSVWPPVERYHGTGPYEYNQSLYPVEDHKIQANVLGKRHFTDHRVEWSWTDDIDPLGGDARLEQLVKSGRGKGTGSGEFVRSLTLGDVVTVWGRARFPAWVNTVERVQIDVYWAV